jgi:precorrin isomerase
MIKKNINPLQYVLIHPFNALIAAACMGILWISITGVWVHQSDADRVAPGEARSVAYFVGNLWEAKQINKACVTGARMSFPIQAECENALQALTLSHVGQNYQN